MELAAPGFPGGPVTCPVLVGRDRPLDALRQLVDWAEAAPAEAAPRERPVRVALVAGDAGIGKSRLVREAGEHARARGWLVLEGASFPQDRASPYAPLIDLLRTHFADSPPEGVARAAGTFAPALAALVPDLLRDHLTGPIVGQPGPEQDRRHLFAGLAHCLASEAAGRPMLVVAEDLHWCDDASLDFLLYLARRPGPQPPLVLGTYRPEDMHPRLRDWLAQVDRQRLGPEIVLEPLGRDEVATMLAEMLGPGRPVSAALVEGIHALAEGNPFCVEELLAGRIAQVGRSRAPAIVVPDTVGADGDTGSVGGEAAVGEPSPGVGLPRSLQAAVQERLARLSPAAREVLRLAAVVGRRFDFELLQVLGHVDEATLLDLVKETIAARLVVEESRDRFAFRHALTRQAAYSELLTRERIALHRTVAETAERAYIDAADGRAGDLAYQFFEAEAWEKALLYARRAAEHARRLYAPRAALEHLARAVVAAERLQATRRDQDAVPVATRVELYHERGRAHETIGELARAQADYEAALELARASGNRRAEWELLVDLGALWTGLDYDRAGDAFERALALARDLGDMTLLGRSLNRVGNWRANAADPRDAVPLHREALALFDAAGDRRGRAETLDLLGMATYLCADLDGSIAWYERAVPLLEQLDDRQGLVNVLSILACRGGSYELGSMTTTADDFERGIRDGERALALARAIDWRAGEAFVMTTLATVVGLLGRHAQGIELATRALRIAEEIGHRQWTAGAHAALGQLYLDLLVLTPARHHLELALADARAINSTFWVQICTACLACAHALDREPDRALAVLGPELPGDAPVRSLGERWQAYAHAHVALARDEPDRAAALLTRVNAPPVDGTDRRATPRPAIVRAEALTRLGRPDEALALLRPVLDVVRRQGARPLAWRCHAVLGDAYRAAGRAEDAQREHVAARSIVEELAAGLPDVAVREAFLRHATARLPRPYRLSPRRAESARHGGLTAREREVAALVAAGRSNREIADALVLGERTVETHVSNALNKLGLSSRRELARWAAGHGLTAK